MEYTIYNESLVYYALRDPKTMRYFSIVDEFGGLHDCCKFPSVKAAIELQRKFSEYSEIRKVKVIDIGKV